MRETPRDADPSTYSYLGPTGTFTELALARVPEARGKPWRSVNSVPEAFDDVIAGRSVAAMVAIESSVDGGISATHDALARTPGLRILGEYLVPVTFVLVTRRGTTLDNVRVVSAHPVAYAQCQRWLHATIPRNEHVPASSNVAAATSLIESTVADAAIAPPNIIDRYDLDIVGDNIGDNPDAITRFVLVSSSRSVPPTTGADKTSVIVELPANQPGSLLDLLEQFASRGVNLRFIQSRPIGDVLGRYRFVIDIDGHIRDERVADALLGVRRYSSSTIFLGSFPRADDVRVDFDSRYDDRVFVEARDWLRGLTSGDSAREP